MNTSPIASVVGRLVTTRNGSEYLLVGPHRWGQNHFCGPEDAPMDAINTDKDGFRPFYLSDGVTPWPPGSTVPTLVQEPGLYTPAKPKRAPRSRRKG